MQKTPPEAGRWLAVSAIGSNQDGLALDLVRSIQERGCTILDSRIVPLGRSLSASFLVSGNWSALGRLETALPALAERLGLKISYHRTEGSTTEPQFRPYAVEVVAPQRGDLLVQLLDFFRGQDVVVSEVVTQNYASSHTGAAMCNLHLVVNVPIDQHPQAMRDSFMDLCDELNADGVLDPIKS